MKNLLIAIAITLLAVTVLYADESGIAGKFRGDWVCVGFIDPDGDRQPPKEKHFLKLTADSMIRTNVAGESKQPPGKVIISETGELWFAPDGTSERIPVGTAKIEAGELHMLGGPGKSNHHLVYERVPPKKGVEKATP
mgnify:CR=1 FL=1